MPFVMSQRLLSAAEHCYSIDGDGPVAVDADGNLPGSATVGWLDGWPIGFAEGPGDHDGGLVGRTPDGVIVAFRGTATPPFHPGMSLYAWMGDWLIDVECKLLPRNALPGRVHTGFQGAVAALWPKLEPEIARAVAAADGDRVARGLPGPAPLFVTGHSKGGGMAPFGAWLLSEAYQGRDIVVRTFAAPNFADAVFRDAYLPRMRQHVRYECSGDAIPHLPFCDDFFGALPVVVQAGLDAVRRGDTGYKEIGALSFIDDDHIIRADSDAVRARRREAFLTALITGRALEAKDRHVLTASAHELYRVAQYQPCAWTV